jgi:catechol 2,3-dioxygenase-like lactoylglutathione lyase family enzyme
VVQAQRGEVRLAAVHLVAIDHVQLAMPRGGEPEARRFYAGVLGLTERPKPEPLASRGGCWFVGDAVQLHLGVEDDFRPARKAHPALVVEDLPELLRRLEDAGFEVRDGDTVDGRVQRFTDDPFGNRIELIGDA